MAVPAGARRGRAARYRVRTEQPGARHPRRHQLAKGVVRGGTCVLRTGKLFNGTLGHISLSAGRSAALFVQIFPKSPSAHGGFLRSDATSHGMFRPCAG